MKISKKLVLFVTVILVTMLIPTFSLAEGVADSGGIFKGLDVKVKSNGIFEEFTIKEANSNDNIWDSYVDTLQTQRKVLKEKMKSLNEQVENFKESINYANSIEDTETADFLLKQIEIYKDQLKMKEFINKQMIKDMKQLMKDKYSAEEWNTLEKNMKDIMDIPGIRVMPAESILMPEGNLKFDVPPVIKNNRMLVPIRAISEALDADVSWDNDTRTAVITTDEQTIVIAVSEDTILVNGEPIETDAPAEIIKGRIVVPLRFIIENMGLDIEWDQETETAEILSQ